MGSIVSREIFHSPKISRSVFAPTPFLPAATNTPTSLKTSAKINVIKPFALETKMYFKPLLIPLLAQVALTFIMMLVMYRKRVNEMKTKRIHPQRTKTRSVALGVLTDSESAANNYSNLFESPVLFYTAILLTLILVSLAWLYVASRYLHSFIHATYNRVMHRFSVFVFSSFILLAFWVRLGWIIIR